MRTTHVIPVLRHTSLAIMLLAATLSGAWVAAYAAQGKGEGKKPAGKKNKKKNKKKSGGGKKAPGKKANTGKKGDGKQQTGGPPGTSQGPSIVKADKPVIDDWGIEDVEEKGRIVGAISHSPGCHIEALGLQMTAIKMVSIKRGDPDFMIEWLDPGTYTVRVTGAGYSLVVPNVPVESASDTFVDIDFPAGSEKGGKARNTSPQIERWPTWRPHIEPQMKVPNFKPKSIRELMKFWDGIDQLDPSNRRKNSGGKHGKGRKKGKHKGRR
ncbi:carboxypeptidase-like regulatory domain-containing protein [Planctomycetota bacterium]